MRRTRPYTYLGTVQGMCRQCRAMVPARVIEQDGAVYQERLCPTCGPSRARIADSVEWYAQAMRHTVTCKPARQPGRAVARGCPHDCGPCALHANACHLAVFSITNACNLACPICFTYNRPTPHYFMTRQALARTLDGVLAQAGPLDLVNLTGGEPTLHPGLLDLIDECRRDGIGRVTVNSNGLALARDESLCAALAQRGAYVILSFDTFEPDVARRIHGQDVVAAKLAALKNLQRHGVGVTLLHVMIRGVNDGEFARLLELARTHPVVRSLTVQTMTYTGAGGRSFAPREHLPLDGAASAIEKATGGEMAVRHFFAHPGAHPLCYQVAYYFRHGPRLRSFTDLLSPERLRRMLAGGYLLQMRDDAVEDFRRALDELWARGGDEELLRQVKALIARLYPTGQALSSFERQRRAEQDVLTVYLHGHMDEDTLDLGRLICCPDQVPDPEGRLIPACAYNLFYRMKDERFYDRGRVSGEGAM